MIGRETMVVKHGTVNSRICRPFCRDCNALSFLAAMD